MKAIRAREPLPTTEVAVRAVAASFAPAGLFPTAEERAVLAGATADGRREPLRRARRAARPRATRGAP